MPCPYINGRYEGVFRRFAFIYSTSLPNMNERNNQNKKNLECTLGFHEFSLPYDKDPNLLLCKYCKKKGCFETDMRKEYDIYCDQNGKIKSCKSSNGQIVTYGYDCNGNFNIRIWSCKN
jgi:hypothetical protein